MTPAAFVAAMLPYARQVQSATGVDAWAVLTQWADETGWGTSSLFIDSHNVAGIKHTGSSGGLIFWSYTDLAAGVADYIAVLGLSYYTGVLAVSGQGTIATLRALGASPWDASHYGSPAGQNLIDLWTSSIAPLAGGAAVATDPTGLLAPLFVAAVHALRAIGQAMPLPSWAAAQGLTVDHLGTVPSLDAGANYLAGTLYAAALSVAANDRSGAATAGVATPPLAPAGSTDPTAILAPIYVGLVDLAHVEGTDVLGAPWAAAQGLTGDHFGHPPSLDVGATYLAGQLDALTAHVTGTVPGPPAPAPSPAPAPAPAPAPTPVGGIPPPLPAPIGAPGPGLAGLFTAWDQLRGAVNTTLPELAARVDAAIAAIAGGRQGGP